MVAQVPIGVHRQGAAVLVPQPAGDGWNIHARFDAMRSEKMPQIVVRNLRLDRQAHWLPAGLAGSVTAERWHAIAERVIRGLGLAGH